MISTVCKSNRPSHTGTGKNYFVVDHNHLRRYRISHDHISLLQTTPEITVVICQTANSDVIAIPIVGRFEYSEQLGSLSETQHIGTEQTSVAYTK